MAWNVSEGFLGAVLVRVSIVVPPHYLAIEIRGEAPSEVVLSWTTAFVHVVAEAPPVLGRGLPGFRLLWEGVPSWRYPDDRSCPRALPTIPFSAI